QHKSQVEGWDPTEMVTAWAREEGEKAGLVAAEGFRRMILGREEKPPVSPAVGTPGDNPVPA
ncbi:MAG: hypothetical protein WBD79_08340, partial [Anaerolineae bacterium]